MIYTCRHCFQTMRRWANVILTSLQVWVVLCLRGVRSIAKRIRFKLEGHVSTFENDFHPATAKPVFSRTRRRRRRCRLHHPRNRYTRPPPPATAVVGRHHRRVQYYYYFVRGIV